MFNQLKLDCIIWPVTAHPAFLHNYSSKISISLSYWWHYNILNFPSAIIPVTQIK